MYKCINIVYIYLRDGESTLLETPSRSAMILKRKQHIEKKKKKYQSVFCKSEREKNLLHVRLIPERARKSRK